MFMNPDLDKEITRMAESVGDIHEEMDTASREGASLEDIEGAKTLAADWMDKYNRLLTRLGPEDQRKLRENIGPAVVRMKEKLTQLKEAPE
jgi:hypothetical protein